MPPSELEGLSSVLEDIAETAAVYGDEQQRTVSRVKYAEKFVKRLIIEELEMLLNSQEFSREGLIMEIERRIEALQNKDGVSDG